ncbi:hypothetical protein [Nocardia terpenica]|uniref:FMN-dependent dehydrogenase domain-containing protein n=1 Tax=Nocardia terpenica TaxID=455432 RepID=A0A6G9ZDR2_9NOCA|nr:hypothetical protein [Nocardia terpenica]QIS23584.1 hypothetical protein F6W96_40275 [Nocardia terpenica]
MIDNRTDDVRFAMDQQRNGRSDNDSASMTFLHHAVAGIDCEQFSVAAQIASKQCGTPRLVNRITGGGERTGGINRGLAVAARATGLPLTPGFMSAYLAGKSDTDSDRVLRSENPDRFVMTNILAKTTVDRINCALDLSAIDALQVHRNIVREIVIPEGDRCFSSRHRNIDKIVSIIGVPAIVTKAGSGLSRKTVLRWRDSGGAVAGVGSRGGTDFARIKNNRRSSADFSCIGGWGQIHGRLSAGNRRSHWDRHCRLRRYPQSARRCLRPGADSDRNQVCGPFPGNTGDPRYHGTGHDDPRLAQATEAGHYGSGRLDRANLI